jgi:hypothetical protein
MCSLRWSENHKAASGASALLRQPSRETGCEENDHAKDDKHGNDSPDDIQDFFRALVEKKTHIVSGTIIPIWRQVGNG